ncbi:TPA: hypothetical protein ACXJEZ_001728 [Providencia rettgeri]
MDKSRQQFEAWFSVNQNNHLDQLKRDQRGNYFYIVTRTAWEAWQASRENLINNLEPVGYVNSIGIFALNRKLNSVIRPNKDDNSITLYRLDK